MARARNIKPGTYKNEDLAECSIWARYIFPGLWMLADREGRLEDRPKRIKGELLPFDAQDVEPLLRELAARGFIQRYQIDGASYIQITKFKEHQSPHYSEKASVIKPPTFLESDKHMEPINSENRHPIKRGSQPPDCLIPDSLIPDSPNPDIPSTPMSGSPPDAPPPGKLNGKAQYVPEAQRVLTYLNSTAGRAFEFRTPKGDLTENAKAILARLQEGYTGEQLREVVLLKAEKWRGDAKMDEFLRPQTLFGKQKFQQYVGELEGAHG